MKTSGTRIALLAALLLVAGPGRTFAGESPLRVLALAGEPAPGTAVAYRTIFSGISMNDVGDIGFVAGLADGRFGQAACVLFADGGFDVFLPSDPVPPELGDSYAWIGHPAINDARSQLTLVGSIPIGWVLEDGGPLEVLVREGDPVDGVPGATYQWNPSGYQLNDGGQALIATPMDTPSGFKNAIFLFDASGTTVVAASGDVWPGGGTLSLLNGFADLNDGGEVAFYGELDSPFRRGVFVWADGQVSAVALEGDAAPDGSGRTLNFPSMARPKLSDSGVVVFQAELEPWSGLDAGIFRQEDGVLSTLVMAGQPAPDSGGKVFEFVGQPDANEAGDVVFTGGIDDDQSGAAFGVYRLRNGTVSKVVQEGDVLPQVGGAVFARVGWPGPSINARGDVAFTGELADGRSALFFLPAGAPPVPSLRAPGALALAAALGLGATASLRGRREGYARAA